MKFGNIPFKEVQNKSIRQLVANFRNEYISKGIDEHNLSENPFSQFEAWFTEAVNSKVHEPNAMYLSTCSVDGRPSGRMMLLKGFDENGFVFFTNYDSRKGGELSTNKFAAITFVWLELYRQVRIEGIVSRITHEESDEYFNSRPRGSQIGAAVSAQSKVLTSREELENAYAELDKEYEGKEIPRPQNWGGFRLKPDYFEFWQGRASRLHDRIIYTPNTNGAWKMERLYP